mgnify:CR=1 FL=1|tara:strand:+ start:1774 stop:2373 length:600 start_codon:yes stop_codon:yes gene_type:complete
MSGAFPTTVALASMTITSVEPTSVSATHSLKRQVRSRGGQRWGLRGSYAPLTRGQAAELFAFSVKQKGQFETFTIVPPTVSTPMGVATGTPLVNGAHVAGDTTIATDGWTVSTTGIMKAGDYIKFGHDKVYMVVADAASSSGGVSTLTIHPALMSALANDESITVSNVPFTVAFASDQQDVSEAASGTFGFSVSLVEVA